MRKFFVLAVFVLISILTAGCTSSAYKDYMEKGNKAMEELKYATAVEAFFLQLLKKSLTRKRLRTS